MSNWHTPKKPTPQQLSLIKERYEVSGAGIVVKTKYHCGPEVGEPVGSLQSHGYLRLTVLDRDLLVHHAVWFLAHDRWPEQPLDHVDGNRINNSPENLREVSQSQNQKAYGKTRGAVGYRGVDFFKSQSKYRARASINGKHKHAGYYDTPEEAAIARDLKAYKDFNYPWEGLNEIGQEYILKHHPDWIKDEM
tara:strand:- start:233 stop:808 length:576 start_codon:yes stop_codon:yes gene_type:complete